MSKEEKPIIVIGDIHGCYHTFKNLFRKITKLKLDIYSVGDLIDRGFRVKETINFALKNKIRTVLGNHEMWMLNAIGKLPDVASFKEWIYVGGGGTVKSYVNNIGKGTVSDFTDEIKDSGHIEFINTFPKFYKIKNVIISHAGIIDGLDDDKMVFNYSMPKKIDQFQVFGHRVVSEVEHVEGHYINIDTGCVFNKKLTAIVVDVNTGMVLDLYQENYSG